MVNRCSSLTVGQVYGNKLLSLIQPDSLRIPTKSSVNMYMNVHTFPSYQQTCLYLSVHELKLVHNDAGIVVNGRWESRVSRVYRRVRVRSSSGSRSIRGLGDSGACN
jgi:hypothetical protein